MAGPSPRLPGHPVSGGRRQRWSLIDSVGAIDAAFDRVIDRQSLRPLLATLPVREQRILAMGFVGGMSQSEIAAQIGVSQMHISRLLMRALTQQRTGLLDNERAPRPTPERNAAQRL